MLMNEQGQMPARAPLHNSLAVQPAYGASEEEHGREGLYLAQQASWRGGDYW